MSSQNPQTPQQQQQQQQQQTATDPLPAHLDPTTYPRHLTLPGNVHLTLTYTPLQPLDPYLSAVSSPSAGANLLFLGTTRNTFEHRPVSTLHYTSYPPLAFKTLSALTTEIAGKHGLTGVVVAHRLGEVPVGEVSVVVGVSAPHRGSAFEGGSEVLERVKERVEVWKREVFADSEDGGYGGDGGGVWKSNRDWDRDGNRIA